MNNRREELTFNDMRLIEILGGNLFDEVYGGLNLLIGFVALTEESSKEEAERKLENYLDQEQSLERLNAQVQYYLDISGFSKTKYSSEDIVNRGSDKEKCGYTTFTELTEKTWLVEALSIGVSADVFWNSNPRKLQPYVDAYKLTRERLREDYNFLAWIGGVYMTHSLNACFSGNKTNAYPDKPFSLGKDSETPDNTQIISDLFSSYALEWNRQFNKNV